MSQSIFSPALLELANAVLEACRARQIMMATAESCTGGLIAGCLTEIAGSSDVVDRGFVTYSNRAKEELIGVPSDLIESRGAVSREVALAMAEGALARAGVGLAVAVTGVAGPGGGSAEKPVGLVHIAAAYAGRQTLHRECRFGEIGRGPIRMATIDAALRLALDAL